jgi:integrase/recombinase XerD
MVNETVHQLYDQISPANQEVVAMLIRNLAEKEGIEAVDSASLHTPREGVELWASDLELQGLTRGTAKSYTQKVEALLDKYANPTEVDIRTFLTNLMKTEKKGTAANYIKAFRSFFRYLYENKLWNSNPALRLKLPKNAYVARRSPTEDEIRKLASVVDDSYDAFIIEFLSNTGLRVSEFNHLKPNDADLDQHRISVIGKGHKQRYIPIASGFFPLFQAYVEKARENNQIWLFPAARSDTKQGFINRGSVAHMLRRYCRKASIENISPHQLRHFFATYLLSRGGDVKAVSELLGHADVTITLKIYHHIGERNIRDVVERLSPASQEPKRLQPGKIIEGEFREVEQ